MAITEITIENFKGIGKKQTIPLRPITLLFGGNSAGKSTILQAIHLFKEVLRTGSAEVDKLIPGTPNLDIGGFEQYVHNRDRSLPVRISVTTTVDDDGLPAYNIPYTHESDYLPFDPHRTDIDVSSVGIEIEISWDQARNQSFVSRYSTSADGELFAMIKKKESSEIPVLVRLENEHSCLDNIEVFDQDGDDERVLSSLTDGFRDDRYQDLCWPELQMKLLADDLEELSAERATKEKEQTIEEIHSYQSKEDKIKAQIEDLRPKHEAALEFEKQLPYEESILNPEVSWLHISLQGKQIIPEANKPFFRDAEGDCLHNVNDGGATDWLLTRIITGSADLMRAELEGTRYIGSLRTIPERGYQGQASSSADRWANGLAAWDLLLRSTRDSTWLDVYAINTMNLGCQIVESAVTINYSSELKKLRNQLVHQTEPPNADELMQKVVEISNQSIVKESYSLTSMDGKTPVAPCDVGVGVSQVIPVLIGVQEPNHSILMVEQPELHIHPRVQCNLGDVLAQQAARNPTKVQLLETHSEHLILRLLRRIKETKRGQLDNAQRPITPETVAVLYVEPGDEGTCIKELRIDTHGRFIDEWPQGFFEERFDELF